MKGISNYFERELNRDIKDINITNTFDRKCFHCGYGKTLVGNATLIKTNNSSDSESDNDSNSDNGNNSDEEICVDFVYYTGCLSENEEMTYE